MKDESDLVTRVFLQSPRYALNQLSNLDRKSNSGLNFDHHLIENFLINWEEEEPSQKSNSVENSQRRSN